MKDIKNLKLKPAQTLRVNPNFVRYISENLIVFVSGSNIIFFDLSTKSQKLIQRESSQRQITYINIGQSRSQKMYETFSIQKSVKARNTIYNIPKLDLKDLLLCTGEYSYNEQLSYINVFKPYVPNVQYEIKSKDKNWAISFITILNNSPYCVAISKRKNDIKKSNTTLSKISYIKYTAEKLISEEIVQEDLLYCCYNPKNTLDIIICGKGYLRLWNVFINEGSMKEHQQRYLKGKQEKEKTFIKAEFFNKKSYLLVGTMENTFYIIEGFQILYELNTCYSIDNIVDLNIQNKKQEEDFEDIIKLKQNIDKIDKDNVDDKLRQITFMSNDTYSSNNNELTKSNAAALNNKTNYNGFTQKDENGDNSDMKNKTVFNRLYNCQKKQG